MSPQARTATAPGKIPAVSVMDYETFLTRLSTKDRLNVERHIAALEAGPEPRHANNWKRLAALLLTLAPHAPKTNGQQSMQFFVPDGKYRMQVFALQDLRDAALVVYVENVLEEAIRRDLLNGPHEVAGEENSYRITGTADSLKIDELDGKSANPAPFYKDMLGWNRRALRITVPAGASDEQIKAVERLCAIAAKKWEGKIAAAK
jgi:hypothetical protein